MNTNNVGQDHDVIPLINPLINNTTINDVDMLNLVHKVCDHNNTMKNKEAFKLLIKYLDNKRENKIHDLSQQTKIQIRSLILDTFEKIRDPFSNLKTIIEILLANHYKKNSEDEEIFRIGLIEWFNRVLKEQDNQNNFSLTYNMFSESTIDCALIALSKIKQQCHASLVLETLEILWKLHYKNKLTDLKDKEVTMYFPISKTKPSILKDEEVSMILSIFKHYEFQQQQQDQLKKDITKIIYKLPLGTKLFLKTKEFEAFLIQTIGILFGGVYDDAYFLPQYKNYDQFLDGWNNLSYREIEHNPIFNFLAYINYKDDETLCIIILDYIKIKFLNATKKSWKEKLIFFRIVNSVGSKFESQVISSLLSKLSDPISFEKLLSIETQDNSILHCELLTFLLRFKDDPVMQEPSIRSIINEGWKNIVNQEPIQPRTLYSLCKYIKVTGTRVLDQQITDQVFLKGWVSNYDYVVRCSLNLILEKPEIVSLPIFIVFLDKYCKDQMDIGKIIRYFDSLVTNQRKTYLRIIISRLLFRPFKLNVDGAMTDEFIFKNILGWIFDGSIGKDVPIYLPAIMKRITTQPTIKHIFQDQIARFCTQFPQTIYSSYIDRLISQGIDLYDDNNSSQDRSGTLLTCLFSICTQYKTTETQKEKSNQLFKRLLDLFIAKHDEDERKIAIKNLIDHAYCAGISLSIEQKSQIIDWMRVGIPIPLLYRPRVDALQQYSELIYQLATLGDDCDYYLEISIYHVEQMLEGIKRFKGFVSKLVSTISHFYKLLETIHFSCQAKNLWSIYFTKYLNNTNTLKSLLFLTLLNE
ncbi:hypothetical protein DFA_10676 [Cavenderia fasciculata]|uniref:Uncharacterized protein n=1 Tax=Cavenderia fasciculata TaxID=261658 RepID=F4QB31_CACFS|nr:uncharacterized protein DFA_10676 [Cavenderia fasciculata]EGG14803.1 hypothetical protein DFA_10676 [Cavenderia fasciculata]|eukprot:XP_004351319.1 hypothetical protein DFA_10676 [Cavenderia fasciculata]